FSFARGHQNQPATAARKVGDHFALQTAEAGEAEEAAEAFVEVG
ncbi:MAG: hypothetical protein RL398_1651, partial [Planctomycetota bacterium]